MTVRKKRKNNSTAFWKTPSKIANENIGFLGFREKRNNIYRTFQRIYDFYIKVSNMYFLFSLNQYPLFTVYNIDFYIL